MTDHLSRNFQDAFKNRFGDRRTFSIQTFGSKEEREITEQTCLFLGLNFSKAEEPLTNLVKRNIGLKIFGIGDWNYFSTELAKLLKNVDQKWKVITPTGWLPGKSAQSRDFATRFQNVTSESPSPVGAYTYDAVILALRSVCDGTPVPKLNLNSNKSPKLLREYSKLSSTNNFISPMQIITYKENKK